MTHLLLVSIEVDDEVPLEKTHQFVRDLLDTFGPITIHTSGSVAISYPTAEYLACLAGQIPWGNQQRRAPACAELGDAMTRVRLAGYMYPQQTLECFSLNTWEVIAKPVGGK